MNENTGQYTDSESPFCKICKRADCPDNGLGCPAWRKYFIDNWNKNITAKPQKTRQFFRYEHPDLVREGIVFENEQS